MNFAAQTVDSEYNVADFLSRWTSGIIAVQLLGFECCTETGSRRRLVRAMPAVIEGYGLPVRWDA